MSQREPTSFLPERVDARAKSSPSPSHSNGNLGESEIAQLEERIEKIILESPRIRELLK